MKVSIRIIYKLFDEYFDKEPNKLRLILKELFSDKENITVFSQFFFSHIITTEIPDFHKDIYKFFLSDKNEAFAAPRGHGKSTTSMISIIWYIVNHKKKYIVYMSQSHSKTVQFIEPIRNEFKINKLLKFVYGDLTPSKSKDDEGRDREDCFDVANCRLEAVSYEKNIRGFKYKNSRPDLIVGDDIEDDDRVLNPELRIKDSNKLNKAILPSLSTDGTFKFIGTILHQESSLKEKIKQYDGKIYRAIDENGNILMPGLYSKEKLEAIKKDIGSVSFESEYMNNPIDTTNALIKPEWIRQCLREDISIEDLRDMRFSTKTLGVDFAFSDRALADSSAFMGLGKKDDFIYLIHNEAKKGMSITEQLNYIKNNINAIHRFDTIALEENSIRGSTKDLSQYNLPIRLFWLANADPKVLKPGLEAKKSLEWSEKRHTVGKFQIINRLGVGFENKRFIIPYKTELDKQEAHKLIAELTTFALNNGQLVEVGVHSDRGIALAYAYECINMVKIVTIA